MEKYLITSSRIKVATIWSSIETLTLTLLSFFSIFFLARILTPSDYGKIAIAQFISALLQLILSLGLSESIIQKKRLSKKDIQTAWVGSIFLSILCCLICIAIGFCFFFTGNKIVSYILYIESINSLFSMLSIVPIALLMRNLEMKKFAYRSIISRVAFFLVAIPLAFNGYGLWSIVYANLINSFIALVLLWFITKSLIPRKFYFYKKRFFILLNFGAFIMLENLLWSIVTRLVCLLIGVFHGVGALGLYSMVTKLLDTILGILNTAIARIALPIFSSAQHDKVQLLYTYQSATYYFNLFSLPMFFSIALMSEYWVPIILGNHWLPICPIINIMAITYGVMYSRIFVGIIIKALGRSKDFLVLSLISATITILVIIVTKNSDLHIVVLALAVPRIIITYPMGAYLIKKICKYSYFSQISPIITPLLISSLIIFSIFVIQQLLKSSTNITSLFLQILIGNIVFLLILFVLNKKGKLIYKK